MLDNKELKDFKMSLTEYINYGMDNALNQRWMKELENASARVHIDRLEQLKLNIQAEAMKLFGTEDKTLTDSIKEAYNERYDINNYIVQKGLGIGFDVANIDQEKLDKLISKPWASDGRNFSNRLWQSKEQMVNNLYNQTVRLSLGGSLKDAIDSMTRYVGREIKNKKYAAQRLIQTEMSYFTSEAQKESYKELGLDKYEIVATLDNKTSSICQEMDGKVYDMKAYQSGVTAPPFHPNCRSTTCPYFDDEFTVGETRKAKDLEGKTYKVPATMNYREWKEEQEKIKQQNSLARRVIVPKNYHEDNNEIAIAETLAKNLDLEVELLKKTQQQGVKNPDARINNEYYEFKTPKSIKGIDSVVRAGIEQVATNDGKIVIDIQNCKGSIEEMTILIQNRVNRSLKNKDVEVLLVNTKTKELINQYQYTKIRGSYSHQQGVKGTSYIKNTTTETIKSQLKNSKENDKMNPGDSRNIIIKQAKDSRIDKIDYKELPKKLTDEEIIKRLAGGDKTKGSCASLSYAYIANKAGLDILDFRGGQSTDFFSKPSTIKEIMNLEGVIGWTDKDKNGIKVAKRILANVLTGKDYLLSAGEHMTVIRKEQTGFKYLNLQSPDPERNGWFDLNVKSLCKRFKYKKQETSFGIKLDIPIELIEAESLMNNKTFRELLKFINTNKGEQQCGESGTDK